MQDNLIEVGRVKSGSIWMGMPERVLVDVRSCLMDRKLKAISLSEDDAKWLVGALRKELYGNPEDDVEIWQDISESPE